MLPPPAAPQPPQRSLALLTQAASVALAAFAVMPVAVYLAVDLKEDPDTHLLYGFEALSDCQLYLSDGMFTVQVRTSAVASQQRRIQLSLL